MRVVTWFVVLGLGLLITSSGPTLGHSWLSKRIAAEQGYRQAMFAVAKRARQQNNNHEAVIWFQRALQGGFSDAAFELIELVPQRRYEWLQHAAAQQNFAATIELAYRFPEQFQLSNTLLASFFQAGVSETLAALKPRQREQLSALVIGLGEPVSLPHWRSIAPSTREWNQRRAGADVFRANAAQCDFRLHFQYERNHGKAVIYQWLSEVSSALQARGLLLCATSEQDPLTNCEGANGRAYCADYANASSTGVNVVVTQRGSANTRNRVIFINESASWRVLFHELGHAFGLADEYPMRRDVAERFCAGDFIFPSWNIITTESSLVSSAELERIRARLPWRNELTTAIASPLLIAGVPYWRLGSVEPDQIGLYPTGTCENTGAQAWRPFSRATFMERSESNFVPELYLNWMLQSMAEQAP